MASEGILVGYGNPLLDICITTDSSFLDKYGLKANDACLADEKHKDMYEEMAVHDTVSYCAGGATLNSIRVAQWLIGKPNATTFFGCISDDKFGKILVDNSRRDGVNVKYQYTDKDVTGTCGVVITDKDRSLCANLAAANLFTADHLGKQENITLIDKAQYFYISSFPLTACPEAVLKLAKHSYENSKCFTMNLSAPFLIQFFKEPMMKVIPYVDILFANETEAEVMAKEHNFGTEDIKEIALRIAALEKANTKRPRMVIITHGRRPTFVAYDGLVTEYPIIEIEEAAIVDTNGAGDAFVGGFLSQLVVGKDTASCIRCGNYAASIVIQNSGCTYPAKPDFI